MALDGELLKKAEQAGAALLEAERSAQLARAEHHAAIRRLHLAGASLREIAAALGLSHQRVAQIVEGAGGSWWQRIWRSRNARRDAVCTFCARPPSEVKKLIAGPAVFLCDGCVELAERTLAGQRPTALQPAPPGSRARCSFCGKRRATGRPLIVSPESSACGKCLALCRQILDNRAG